LLNIRLIFEMINTGVFIQAKKNSNAIYQIYLSIQKSGRRTTLIPKLSDMPLKRRLALKLSSSIDKLKGIRSLLFYCS
jgi:hypothetical protein